MRVLAVGAHPDDLELLCGGTLARFVREGHQVAMCHASLGDRGSFVHTAAEITQIRLPEAQAAASIIGAEHHTLGRAGAEVNAASPHDYMADHNEVSRLMLDASHIATLPLTTTKHPAHNLVPAVYYMKTLAGVGFAPSEYVDISADVDTRLAALRAHHSQLTWLRDHDGVDIVEWTRVVSAFRGFQSGVAMPRVSALA
jgi:LmbE family N-acetylglucosaminyl deacetylase